MNQVSIHAMNPVRERIERAALRSGRDPSAIQLVVVTKGVSLESIRGVLGAGAQRLGENRVQEALPYSLYYFQSSMQDLIKNEKIGKREIIVLLISFQKLDSLFPMSILN